MKETQGSENVLTKIQRVAEVSKQAPEVALTTLAHHIDMEFLKDAHRRTRKDGAVGVDGEDSTAYAENLETNLQSLLERFKAGSYKAPPVRRTYIPKGDGSGRQRELGIPTFEDKILQRAVTMVLEAVYEQEFYDFSYAYRPGRTQHQALQRIWEGVMRMGGGWLLEVDIQDCFGSLNHQHLRACLDKRVRDGVIRKAIDKWLKAGIWEAGQVEHPETGTPQGGVISPLLSNIYLHEVIDTWFDKEVKPRMYSESFMIRWADDIVIVFANEVDAKRVQTVLPKRFEKYGLTVHPTKTKLTEFRRPNTTDKEGKGKFDFLGFTHFWAKSRNGKWIIRRKTASKRLSSRVQAVTEWCRRNRSERLRDQWETLCLKIRGHYQYYGITGNIQSLEMFLYQVKRGWFKWLNRRSQKKSLNWDDFKRLMELRPLPQPKITHSYLKARPTS